MQNVRSVFSFTEQEQIYEPTAKNSAARTAVRGKERKHP